MTKNVKQAIAQIINTAIYVRVSTEEQAQEGFSIRAQTEKLKTYALLKEWDIYDIYVDEGISGKNIIDRPEINRLIKDIKDGKVNNVLVFKVDRLTRSIKNLMELVETFDEYNCAFNSLTESIDTETPSGRMFLKIIGIFAEFERENLISRVTLGLERKAKEGYSLANYISSYGYELKKGEKIQTVIPHEAKIVREVFEMYVKENMSMLSIAKELTRRNIKTKKNNSRWNKTTITGMLENPNYIGKIRYSTGDENRYFEADGKHEAIIDKEIFQLAQEKISRNNRTFKTKTPKEDKYFCGVLYCGKCGKRFSGHQNRSTRKDGSRNYTPAYKCGGTTYDGCIMPTIVHHKVESIFNEHVAKNSTTLKAENAEIKNRETPDKKQLILEYITECEKKLKASEERKKQVMAQYMENAISFEEYKELLEISNGQYIALVNEIEKSTAEIPIEKESQITREDIITDLIENWDRLNNKERFIFLQRFVKKIVIDAEKINKKHSIIKIVDLEFNEDGI